MAQQEYDPYDPYGMNQQNDGSDDPGGGSGVPPPPVSTPPPPASTTGSVHAADPWSVAPPDGDWEAWFQRNIAAGFAGMPSPDNLQRIAPQLEKLGIKVLKNASGIAGKIQLPGGKIIDVGGAFSSGDPSKMSWQWLESNGDEFDWDSAAIPPPDAYEPLARPDYLKGEYTPQTWDEQFVAPDAESLKQDPGYQARLDASRQAFERGAAAKGSILSGGSQVALSRRQGEQASQEYGAKFDRDFKSYMGRYGQFSDARTADFAARGINEDAYQSDNTSWLNRYLQRYRTYRDAIGDSQWLAEQGKPVPPPV